MPRYCYKRRAESIVAVHAEFISAYPTAATLANADFDDVERRLRPLGLSRKRAAQMIGMARAVREHGEAIFDDWKTLLADVPGLGAYAARAIACFARGEPVGIVDANVVRIERRVFQIAATDRRAVIFQHYADEIASAAADARATNFGLLDLGARICLPSPRCGVCPLNGFCPKYGARKKVVSRRK